MIGGSERVSKRERKCSFIAKSERQSAFANELLVHSLALLPLSRAKDRLYLPLLTKLCYESAFTTSLPEAVVTVPTCFKITLSNRHF